jgi:hypothetical protein
VARVSWALLLSLAVAAGCASRPAVLSGKRYAVTCGAGATLPSGVAKPGEVLLFGELHGTEEIPAVFGEAVCAVAREGTPVAVGLEVAKSEQAAVDAFLASGGGAAAVDALKGTPHFTRGYQDGRSSRAMAGLLERLRQLRAAGLPVDVFLVDLDPAQRAPDRDRGMAGNLAAAARAHPRSFTMVLIGEVHAWKAKGAPWKADFVPMGRHLVEMGLPVQSFGRATPAGTAWVCLSADAADCGSRKTKATAETLPSGRKSGIELLAKPSERGFDGLFATATLTASPPAAETREKR